MRCRSWRATHAHSTVHAPGSCRTCWRPCTEKVAPGATRCRSCTTALINHPDPQVRLAALSCRLDTDDVVYLASDFDLGVNLAARDVLADMGVSLRPDTDITTDPLTWDHEQEVAAS